MAALPLIATKLAFPRAGVPFTFAVTSLCWDCRPLQPALSLLRRSLSYMGGHPGEGLMKD